MKRNAVSIGVLIATALVAVSVSWGELYDEPYTYTQEATNPVRTVIVGVTLGYEWDGFPSCLAPSYDPDPGYEEYEVLDVELPLYVTWILDTGEGINPAQKFALPEALNSFSWFTGNHSRFQMVNVSQVGGGENVWCPQYSGIELPEQYSYPLTEDGQLRVADTHGGIGSLTILHFKDCRPSFSNCQEMYNIILSWNRPGTWRDYYLSEDVNCDPEDVYNRGVHITHGGFGYDCYTPTRVVEWVSSDIGLPRSPDSPSPRVVDAADLALFTSKLGQPIRWGFATDEVPANSPTFYCDVNPFNGGTTISAGDLSWFVNQLGNSCQLSKSDADNEVAAVLEWFGVAATGRKVVAGPNGETLPEYDVVDWQKAQRAIADPYGYHTSVNSAPAKEIPWSLVKRLYR